MVFAPGLFLLTALMSAPPNVDRARVTGTIRWTETSTPTLAVVLRDRHVCGRSGEIWTRPIAVDTQRRLAQAVVWIESSASTPLPTAGTARIDQHNCQFVPVAQAAVVGTTVWIGNSDPVLHNVHVHDPTGRTLGNWAMPAMNQQVSMTLGSPGVWTLSCDAGHQWMRASIRVFEHGQFATTGADGKFTIPEVAPGTHRVFAWHPEIGQTARAIVVPPGKEQVVTIDLDLGETTPENMGQNTHGR